MLERDEDNKILPPEDYEEIEGGVTIRRRHSTMVIYSKAEGSEFPFPLLPRPDSIRKERNPDLELDQVKISKHGEDYEETYSVEPLIKLD